MTSIGGLDISTSRTGLATPDGRTHSITPRHGADERGRRLGEIKTGIERAFRLAPPMPDVVLIESYALASKGIQSTITLAEVGGVIRDRLTELDIAYIEITPSRLKRYATGNGNADKERMLDAALGAGGHPRNHDEADAWWLWHLGSTGYGQRPGRHEPDPALRLTRLEIVADIRWPVTA